MEDEAAFWAKLLRPSEKLLWNSRPDTRAMFRRDFLADHGIRHAVFAIFILLMVTQGGAIRIDGANRWGLVIQCVIITVCLVVLATPWIRLWRKHRLTRYALTTERALIWGADEFGKIGLQSWPVLDLTSLSVEIGRTAALWFAWGKSFRVSVRKHSFDVTLGGKPSTVGLPERVGFFAIPDAPQVHRMILQLQSEAK